MQQSIGNNRISLIVNNHIQQFEINATILQQSNKNLKPPLYRGNAHFGGQLHKKNHSLSIHQNGGQYMMNQLKVIPTNNKKQKLLSINNNNSHNISITNSVNNQVNSNHINSFHRPQSPVVLNISSDRHCLYQQQHQNSFQHISSHNQKVYSNHQFLGQIGANLGLHPIQRDRTLNFRQNSLKVIGRLDNRLNKNKIGSNNVLQSINYQKNNIYQMNESPITKSKNYLMNGSSSNDQISDLEKINNSNSNINTNNNGTILNLNSCSYMQMNNSLSSNTNCNNNTNSNINQNIISNNLQNNSTEGITNIINNNITTSNNREKKCKISKTQILFPFNSRDNLTVTDSQDTIRSSHKNIFSQKIVNNAKIINNQNFEEDEILNQKACTQPTDILREQMALETPPQFATYTTSATTDTMNRQTFRIRPYNMSSRQSSRGGGQKSSITSNIPSSSITQQENIIFDNNIEQINNISNSNINNIDLTDISPNIVSNHQLNKQQVPGQRILSSRSSNKVNQNPKRRIFRQPSSNLVLDEAANINLYHPQQNCQNQLTQKEVVVRKNSYWFNQRGQLQKKKKKEKSMNVSNNDIVSDALHNQQHTERQHVNDHEEDHKNQHFLFKFPSKEDKINCNAKEIEKNDQNNQKRENSPKGNHQKLSKRQSIVRINQKQHYMHTHQPAPQISSQQFPQNQINGFEIQNNILNIKPLTIKKTQNNMHSKNHESQQNYTQDPYKDVELRELLGEGIFIIYNNLLKMEESQKYELKISLFQQHSKHSNYQFIPKSKNVLSKKLSI